MEYLSAPFFVLVVAAMIACVLCAAHRRPAIILVASLLFYLAVSPLYFGLVLALVALAYWAARKVDAAPWALGAAGAAMVGTLVFFKLIPAWPALPRLLAPLGLSYLVFRLLSYLIEVYWRRQHVETNFGRLALFGLFFPQIVSGPIERPGHFFPQLDHIHVDLRGVERGLRLIAFGIFQKLVADQLAVIVSRLYQSPESFSALELVFGAYAFSFELYLDFAGITDVAIGLGSLFGIETPENFNRPFFSKSIQEFWQRWHISLTSWLTDYLFTPMWFSLRESGTFGLIAALLTNMLVIGLWHGARWTFVIFGALNGAYMTIAVLTRRWRATVAGRFVHLNGLRAVGSRLLLFNVMSAFFVFIRADSLATATTYLARIAGGFADPSGSATLRLNSMSVSGPMVLVLLAAVVAVEAVHWLRRLPGLPRLHSFGRPALAGALVAFVVYMTFCRHGAQQQFLYAQF